MFHIIIAFYFFSASGQVSVHTQAPRTEYKTLEACETAGKKIQGDLSVPATSFQTGNSFKEAVVRYSCTK